MKVRINRWYNALLASLFALLGFESCNSSSDEPCEYGAPHADYLYSGTVTDEQGNPLEGIKARLSEIYEPSDEQEQPYINNIDSAKTDANGKFTMNQTYYFDERELSVILEDEDGPANGGEFESAVVKQQDMKKEQVEQGKSWYKGKFRYSFTRQLKKK